MPYGNFYYGKGGFKYKKMSGGGVRRNFSLQLMDNQPHSIYNSYVPGAGVGATSIASRRAKLIRATKCSSGYKCGRFYTYIGIKPLQTNTILDIISEKLQQKQGIYCKNNVNSLNPQDLATGLTQQGFGGGLPLGGHNLGSSQFHQNLGLGLSSCPNGYYDSNTGRCRQVTSGNINDYQTSTGSGAAGGGT